MTADAESNQRSLVPFIIMWLGQAFSLIGSQIAQFALVWWLTQSTGSATVLATATLVAVLPQVLLGPLAGAVVDRFNRKLIMMLADSLVALAALWLIYQFWLGEAQVWQIYVIMLIRSLGGSFHWPAMQASTSLMVPEKHLTRVAGFNQTLQGGLNIVAPPIGALLLAVMPMYGVLLIDVGTALVAVVNLFFVSVPQPEPDELSAEDEGATSPSLWGDMKAGLRYIWNWTGLMVLMCMAMLINFILTPAFSLLPLLVTNHFHGGAIQLGWLESSSGIGIVLGGLLLGIWGGFRRRIFTSLLGVSLMGLCTLVLGLTPATMFWLAIAMMFSTGFLQPLTNGPIFAILQATVAPNMQGRVFTVVGSLSAAITPLSLLVAGPIADAVGIQIWYIIGGIACVLVGVIAVFIPAVVNIEQSPQAERSVVAEISPLME